MLYKALVIKIHPFKIVLPNPVLTERRQNKQISVLHTPYCRCSYFQLDCNCHRYGSACAGSGYDFIFFRKCLRQYRRAKYKKLTKVICQVRLKVPLCWPWYWSTTTHRKICGNSLNIFKDLGFLGMKSLLETKRLDGLYLDSACSLMYQMLLEYPDCWSDQEILSVLCDSTA